jgi:hypothetical protein|tara:strand:- start:8883 stop:10325 length:1443 start_codon:yes stop_codon:yes gene_type:complete
MSAILRINLENKSTITTPPSGYISLFAGADTGAPFTNEHLSVINPAGTLLRVPYLEENLTVATGYNFQQSVDVSGNVWVGTDHTVVANTILGSTCVNTLLVNATSTFNCGVTLNGGLTLSGDTTMCGDLNLCGCPPIITSGMTGTTATTVPTLYVSKISACTGTLSISNNVDICGDLNMCCVKTDESWTGATSANTGTTAVTTTLTVSQISGCSGNLKILTPTIISGTTTIYGDTTIIGDLDLCNNLVTTTYVTGCTYDGLVSSTCVSGGTPITGYTATTSAVTVTSTTYNTLHVNTISACTGTVTIQSNLDVSGNTYIADGTLSFGDENGEYTKIDGLGTILTNDFVYAGRSGYSAATDTWAGGFKHSGVAAAVTQQGSVVTTVEINSTAGKIRLYDAGGSILAPNQGQIFRVMNNMCYRPYSLVLLTVEQGVDPEDSNLTASLTEVADGYFDIRLYNSGTAQVELAIAGKVSFLIINP